MTTGHVFIATSLDGFVARLDDTIDWLMKQKTEGEEHGFDEFIASVDGLVMGRGSYENVLTFGEWPYTKPVVVMSRTLSDADIPEHLESKVRFSSLEPGPLMESLAQEGWTRAYVDGGRLVQSFLRDGLLEDIALTTIPVLIGTGKRLFGEIESDIDLELIDVKSFPSGLVTTRYRIARGG